jgi:hypothetical protein
LILRALACCCYAVCVHAAAGDLALFWAIDGGVPMIQLFVKYGVDLDASTPKGWTPLSYARAKGKYGPTEEKGVYPEVGWMHAYMEWDGRNAGCLACLRSKQVCLHTNERIPCLVCFCKVCFVALQDVLRYYGASTVGSGPPVLGTRSPRASFNPEDATFSRERGSYQNEMPHP